MLQPKKATDDDYDDNNGDSGSDSRNTWAARGIPGNWEAGDTHLCSHMNTWESTGILGNLQEYLVAWRLGNPTWAAIRILWDL